MNRKRVTVMQRCLPVRQLTIAILINIHDLARGDKKCNFWFEPLRDILSVHDFWLRLSQLLFLVVLVAPFANDDTRFVLWEVSSTSPLQLAPCFIRRDVVVAGRPVIVAIVN